MRERIINRPTLTTPTRQCLSCGSDFRAAWGWLFLPDGGVVDLDGACARRLRYAPADERRKLVNEVLARAESAETRRAA